MTVRWPGWVGTAMHGLSTAVQRGAAQTALGCPRVAARLCPHPTRWEEVPAGAARPHPSPPIPPPGWRCLPGLCALLTHFLPSASNSSWRPLLPAFCQLKKPKTPGIFWACGSRRLQCCRAPCQRAGAAWGGDSGCKRCPFAWGTGLGLSCNAPMARSFFCGPFCVSAPWMGSGTCLFRVCGSSGCLGIRPCRVMFCVAAVPGAVEQLLGTGVTSLVG